MTAWKDRLVLGPYYRCHTDGTLTAGLYYRALLHEYLYYVYVYVCVSWYMWVSCHRGRRRRGWWASSRAQHEKVGPTGCEGEQAEQGQ